MGKGFKNPFARKKKTRAADVAVAANNTEQNAPERVLPSFSDEQRAALRPSEAETDALTARLTDTSTAATEDQGYLGLVNRATGMEDVKKETQRAVGRARSQLKRGTGSAESVAAAEANQEHFTNATDGLYASADQERAAFLDRHTADHNANLTSAGALGSGMVNTVHRVARADGSTGVFKAEGSVPDAAMFAGADSKHSMAASREVASSRMDDLLGSNVLARAEFASMDGQRGTVMDMAAGHSVRKGRTVQDGDYSEAELAKLAELELISNIESPDGTSRKEVLESQTIDYASPAVQRGLIELQIQDALSGQLDRHAENYHVAHNENGEATGVTGFDNDASFGKKLTNWESRNTIYIREFHNTVGLPPLLDEDQAARILALDPEHVYSEIGTLLPEAEASAARSRVLEMQEHVRTLQAGGGIVSGWNDDTYAQLRNGEAKSSYVGRDAAFQDALKEKEAAFAAWQEAQAQAPALDADLAEMEGVAAPEADTPQVEAPAAEQPMKKKKRLKLRNPFKKKKR